MMNLNCAKFVFNNKIYYLFFEDFLFPDIKNTDGIFNKDDILLCRLKYLDELFFYSFDSNTWYPFIENMEESPYDKK